MSEAEFGRTEPPRENDPVPGHAIVDEGEMATLANKECRHILDTRCEFDVRFPSIVENRERPPRRPAGQSVGGVQVTVPADPREMRPGGCLWSRMD